MSLYSDYEIVYNHWLNAAYKEYYINYYRACSGVFPSTWRVLALEELIYPGHMDTRTLLDIYIIDNN